MPKEVYAVLNPLGEIFYASINPHSERSAQLVAVNRFWSSWDELLEAGWTSIKMTLDRVAAA